MEASLIGRVGVDRILLAKAGGFHTVEGDALRVQITHDRLGTVERQGLVVLVRAEAVCVADNLDAHLGIGIHHHRHLVKVRERLATQTVRIKVKVDIEQAQTLVADVDTQFHKGIHLAKRVAVLAHILQTVARVGIGLNNIYGVGLRLDGSVVLLHIDGVGHIDGVRIQESFLRSGSLPAIVNGQGEA